MHRARVLVVQGETLSSTISRGELDAAFAVERTQSADVALRVVRTSPPAVVLCDGRSTDPDPMDVCRAVRRRTATVPVVITCDMCSEAERVKGFQNGVDDYLCGPVSEVEFRERLNAIIRRSYTRTAPPESRYSGRHLLADFEAVDIKVDGCAVELTRREFDLLRFLVEHRNRLLTRDQLLSGVWHSVTVNDRRTVDAHIRKLRTKLGSVGRQIQTLPGRGYRFVEDAVAIFMAVEISLGLF